MVVNLNETSMADKSPVTDGTAAVKHDSSEDGNELHVVSKPETKHPYLPKVPVNRRKMGSSRRIKGKQNVRGVESKSNQEFGEEVKKMTKSTALTEPTQKGEQQKIVHVSEASEDNSFITSGDQSGITSPYLKEGKGLEVDSEEIKEDSHNVGPSELSSKDVLSHSLDKQLNVMSSNLSQGEMQSNEKVDMQWFTENEKCSSFKRSLKSTTQEELTDRSSPSDRTDELVDVDKSSYSSKALFHPSIFRDDTENTVKENAASLDIEGQAECQDNFQNKQMKSILDHSGNKERLGPGFRNTGKRQVMEDNDMDNWNSGVSQPHSLVDAMFSPEVYNNSMTNIVVSNLKTLNPKSGYVQDPHQMETNFEHERSDKSLETKIKGLNKSTEHADSAQLEDKAGKVPEKEVKPTDIHQAAQKHYTFERVTDDGTDSNTFSSPLTDQANKMYKPEINQISTNASPPISHEHNAEKTRLQDTSLSEIECKNNTSQTLPSALYNPINFQQKCPSAESHPETVSKENVEKPVKHFSGDESTVSTMSLLELIERKSDDGSKIDVQSASCDGFVQLEKPGEVTLKKMDESEDGQMLQAVQIVKASAEDANNGTYISDINLKNDPVYEDKDFKNIAKTEDSVEVKQDAHSGSHVEILTSPFIGQITKDHKELEEVLLQTEDEHSNLSSSDIRETQHSDSFVKMYDVEINEMPIDKTHQGKYIPNKSGLKTSENVALVDSTLQPQSGKSGSDTGLKIRNRRKLGSSRRNKMNIVTEKDNAAKNEEVETTELEEHISGGEYRSQRKEKPKNSSEEDNNENEYKEISKNDTGKDQSTQILGQLTGTDTFMDSIESFQASVLTDEKSNTQGISSNNDGDNLEPSKVDITDKAQSGTSLCNKHSPEKMVSLQSTENMKETVGLVTISCSQSTKGSKNGDVGLYCEDRINKTHTCGELNPSPHVVVSGTETWAVNEPDGCTTSISNDSSNSIQPMKTHMDDIMSDKKSGQKQRALGTTQKLQPNSKHNEGMEKDERPQSTPTAKNTYLPASVEETILKTNQIISAQDTSNDLQCSSTDLQIIDRNLIPIINDLNGLLTEQSAFPRVEVVNSEPCSRKVADVKETERMDVSPHTSQLGSFTKYEVQMISDENPCSVSQADKNTERARGSSPVTESPTSHNENEIEENLKIEQINKVDQEAQSLTSEIEILSVTSTFVNRRRMMGSNRKNPKFFPKEEENEATERKTTTDSEQTHLHCITVKQGEEQGKEGVSETVEHTLNTESHLNPKTLQTDEGTPTPPSQQGETKDQIDPGFCPSPSSESQTLSEQASVGRRRKLGSHRKSRGQNYNEDRSAKTFDMEHQSHVRSDPDDGETKATESDCPDKVPKDDESSRTPLSNVTLTKNGENSIIMGKQTSVQSHEAGKDIQNKIPLAGVPKEVEASPNHYNMLMIGDSNVGKTSFIKRAQSGKFSLDVPSSVGLDFCKWTVMVDGKPVVLHVWDTAGQERFRSITRQIFHRAQAFLLMYDISSAQSFSAVSYWANCIQDSAGENVIILLVGNKCDRAERQVRSEEGENLAKEHAFAFSECSAASGENVIECLETVARMLSQMSDSKREATLVHTEGGKTKRSTCC